MYLVVDDDKRTMLWDEEPAYFLDYGRWTRPGAAIMDSIFFPPLKKIAADLGLTPGREGILRVDFVLRPAATPPAEDDKNKR